MSYRLCVVTSETGFIEIADSSPVIPEVGDVIIWVHKDRAYQAVVSSRKFPFGSAKRLHFILLEVDRATLADVTEGLNNLRMTP